jgi:hypothetical protein
MRLNKITTLLILLSLFLSVNVSGQRSGNPFFSLANRLKFAANLYEQKDFIRAFDEYRELLKSVPNDTLRLNAGLALRNIKRFGEAEDYFKGLFFFSELKDYAKLEFLKTEFIRADYNNFYNLLNNKIYLPDTYKLKLERLSYFGLLVKKKSQLPDSGKFVSVFPVEEKNVIGDFYYQKQHPEIKNPLLAAALSTILPGAGKFYTEDYSDGAVALIFTGLFYGLAAHNFAKDKNLAGAVYAGIGLFFHAGSVYGSATSAQIYNAGKRLEFQSKLIDYAQNHKYFLPDTEKMFIFKKK